MHDVKSLDVLHGGSVGETVVPAGGDGGVVVDACVVIGGPSPHASEVPKVEKAFAVDGVLEEGDVAGVSVKVGSDEERSLWVKLNFKEKCLEHVVGVCCCGIFFMPP